jgi:pilus assembly protein CpaE
MNQSLTFVIFGQQPNMLNELANALSDHKRARVLTENNDATEIYTEVVRLRPTAAIITLDADPEQGLDLFRQLAAECPETMLIGAALDASPDLILNSLRAGAQEFLRLPLISYEFEGVLDRVAGFAAKQATAPHRKGRVIAVFSNKGGCGVSFIASNLAVALGAPTAIVDLNLQAGDLGFYFHLEPKFTLTNMIENLSQMDDMLLVNLLTPYSPNVSLLAAPRDVDAAIGVRATEVREVIDLLRKRFDYVVIDLAHLFDEVTLAALDQADDILLVLNTEIMTIRSAQRALTVFDRLDYPREKIRVIANRWDKKLLSLNWQQIERFLGKCDVSFIPDDSRAVINSINLGQPLVENSPSASISVEIRRLVRALAGRSDAEAKPLAANTPALNKGQAATHNETAMPSSSDARSWKMRLGSIFSYN